MQSESGRLPRSILICAAVGGALLLTGVALLAGEEGLAAGGLPAGPAGANLVIVGTVLSAWACWSSWHWLTYAQRLWLAPLLVVAGIGLWLLAASFEPLLMRVLAAVAIALGLSGAMRSVGELVPRFEHTGSVPQGEKLAWLSLLTNGVIVAYLFVRTAAIAGNDLAAGSSGLSALAATAVVIVLILLAESIGLRILRGAEAGDDVGDERDSAIRDAADRAAYLATVVGIVFLAIQISLGELSARTAEANRALGLADPLGLAHVLIAVLFLSRCVHCLAQVWQYERARF